MSSIADGTHWLSIPATTASTGSEPIQRAAASWLHRTLMALAIGPGAEGQQRSLVRIFHEVSWA